MTAWALRPTRTVVYEQRISVTRTQRVERTVFTDALLIDSLHDRSQLSDRQYDAACRLAHMRRTAGMDRGITARLDTLRDDVEDETDADSDGTPPEEIEAAYHRLMRLVGDPAAGHIGAMLLGQHPGVRWLATVQDGLTRLADYWGMER